MAQGKNNILVYRDWIHQFDKLTDEEAGQLIKHFFKYVNDLNPEPPNRIIEISFEPIKQTLKRDLQKWESTLVKKSNAGLASAEKRKQNQQVLTCVESVEQKPTHSTDRDNDSVNDSVVYSTPCPQTDYKSFDKQLFYNLEAMKCSIHWEELKEYVYGQTHKSPTKDKFYVGDVLVKYNLHLEEKRIWELGLTPKQFGAGVAKWVMNEEKFSK